MTASPVAHVLIVDDEPDMRELLCDLIETNGLRATAVEDGAAMRAELDTGGYALLILDLRLRREDGLTLARSVRESSAIPIMILTGKGDETDRILGLELAADDYLMKPFNPRELVARIQAVLRRRVNVVPGAPTSEDKLITFGDVEVDLATRTLKRNGELMSLTTGEFAVLKVLLEHPRQPLSRDRLMTLARGREQGPFDRAIDVQVSRLRKLVEPDPSVPRYLQTVWGFGYVFIPDGQTK